MEIKCKIRGYSSEGQKTVRQRAEKKSVLMSPRSLKVKYKIKRKI